LSGLLSLAARRRQKPPALPPSWDGRTVERIVEVLERLWQGWLSPRLETGRTSSLRQPVLFLRRKPISGAWQTQHAG